MNYPTIISFLSGLLLLPFAYRDMGQDALGAVVLVLIVLYLLIVPYMVNCLIVGGCVWYAWIAALLILPVFAELLILDLEGRKNVVVTKE